MRVRAANATVGLWLFFSSFFWPHSAFEMRNAWVSGIIAVTAAIAGARGVTWARYANATLGAWLILTGVMPVGQRSATVWNQILCGFLLVFFGVRRGIADDRLRRPVEAP
jgi:hypothetical protein